MYENPIKNVFIFFCGTSKSLPRLSVEGVLSLHSSVSKQSSGCLLNDSLVTRANIPLEADLSAVHLRLEASDGAAFARLGLGCK